MNFYSFRLINGKRIVFGLFPAGCYSEKFAIAPKIFALPDLRAVTPLARTPMRCALVAVVGQSVCRSVCPFCRKCSVVSSSTSPHRRLVDFLLFSLVCRAFSKTLLAALCILKHLLYIYKLNYINTQRIDACINAGLVLGNSGM